MFNRTALGIVFRFVNRWIQRINQITLVYLAVLTRRRQKLARDRYILYCLLMIYRKDQTCKWQKKKKIRFARCFVRREQTTGWMTLIRVTATSKRQIGRGLIEYQKDGEEGKKVVGPYGNGQRVPLRFSADKHAPCISCRSSVWRNGLRALG